MSRYSDICLAILVVAIIGLMIMPMPTIVVDALLSFNLALSVIILMISTYIPSALSFSVFPSILLLTTLFRLALSITTTRLILLNADAGKIIDTFGNFVVGGNLVVGAVIFLILTIVQFLVIAKGSERVAEVAARFTLDAMPGKQMSIDADMRAGVIDMEEARKRRTLVTKESQLYGAMDGAMKFVKGDAIAGIIITMINIVGGLCIGTLQRGMAVGEALETYAILTIGDGLVSQIPALLICIAAGVVVTRVSADEGNKDHLAGEISAQMLSYPRALLIGGGLLFLFALIPGFPKPQLLALSAGAIFLGYSLKRASQKKTTQGDDDDARLNRAMAAATEKDFAASSSSAQSSEEAFSIAVPLMIDLDEGLRQILKPGKLNEEIIKVRRALYYDLGVPFPGIHLRFRPEMEENSYSILLQEIPMSKGWLMPGKVLTRETDERLEMMGFAFEQGKNFLPYQKSLWSPEEHSARLEKAGLSYFTLPQVLSFHVSFLLKKHAAEFLGLQETRYLLSNMETRYSELVKEVQRIMPLQKIAEVLQRLVQEQISIRNLRTVLEALIEWGQKEKDTVLLTEYIRTNLRRQISYQHSGGLNVLSAFLLDPAVEELIRGAVRQTNAGSFLALTPENTQRLNARFKETIGELSPAPPRPVLLTSMDIRRYVRTMVELDYYDLPVLSYQDLTQEITVQPIARIET
jgi:type III secretion protein V